VGEVTTETVTIYQPAVSPGIGLDVDITELDPDNDEHPDWLVPTVTTNEYGVEHTTYNIWEVKFR